VDHGDAAERKVELTYAGRETWKILDVRSANPNLEVELNEKGRGGGRVTYEMLVRLTPGAEDGYLEDQLTMVTNDARLKNIAISVEGRVVSPLTVSPGSLFLGVLEPGKTVTKQLVVKGKTPFRILGVTCGDGENFEFKVSDEAKPLHLIPVTFTAGASPGKFSTTIQIETDLPRNNVASCQAAAMIKDRADTQSVGADSTAAADKRRGAGR
jgi:hypothetical protein